MDTLKNKNYEHFDYLSRYTPVPYYYDTLREREVYGIGYPLLKDSEFVLHKVLPEDNLDSLALKYYNNPTYWWIIAYYNDILDAFINLSSQYNTIKIPKLSSIRFGEVRS